MLESTIKKIARRLPLPPIEAILEPTKICNLKCDYCRRNEPASVRNVKGVGNHFTIDQFKVVLDKLKYIRMANWIGDGEPLLNPDFNKLIEIASNRGVKTSFGTNATLITKQDVDFWKKHKVAEVSVSLDSPIPEKYEKMRVGASFDKVIKSCKLISEAGIPLQLQIILFADSVQDMPKYVELCKEVGGDRIALPRLHLYDSLDRYLPTRPVAEEANPILQIALEKMKAYKIKWYEPWLVTTYLRRCMWPFGSPYIRIGGVVQPCCFMSGTDRIGYYEGIAYKVPATSYEMGNILTDDFNKIWHGENYKRLRKLLIKSEKTVGTTIEPEQLKELKELVDGEYAYCYGCSWRWSIEC